MVLKVAIDQAVRERVAREKVERWAAHMTYLRRHGKRKKPVYSPEERAARSRRARAMQTADGTFRTAA